MRKQVWRSACGDRHGHEMRGVTGFDDSRSLPFRLSTNVLVFLAMWAGPRSTIKKIARLAPMIIRFRNSMKLFNHEPHMASRGNRRDQAHAMARTRGFDDGRFTVGAEKDHIVPWRSAWSSDVDCHVTLPWGAVSM